MKHIILISLITGILLSGIDLKASTLPPPIVTRGPYLQVGTQTSIIVRWRTDISFDSIVTWRTVFGTYPNIVDSSTSVSEYIVQISGPTPDTKYQYTDMLGKNILLESFGINAGGGSKNINLKTGVYIIVLTGDVGARVTKKIIVP